LRKSRQASTARADDLFAVRMLVDNAPWRKGEVVRVTAEQAEKFVERQRVAEPVDDDAGR
jgi:hypothetical protein